MGWFAKGAHALGEADGGPRSRTMRCIDGEVQIVPEAQPGRQEVVKERKCEAAGAHMTHLVKVEDGRQDHALVLVKHVVAGPVEPVEPFQSSLFLRL